MQACYVNTTHPDFISGHKAMAIVNDRMNANKPPEKPIDPKSGKLAPGQLNNGKDLDADFKKEEPSFFNSFFNKDKNVPRRKGTPVMDAVSMMQAPQGLSELIYAVRLATAYHSTGSIPERARDHGDRGHQ